MIEKMVNKKSQAPASNPPAKLRKKFYGEPWVWLTSLGLAIGLLMIFFLLGVVIKNGLNVFWPKDIAYLELKENSAFKIMGRENISGVVVEKRDKHVMHHGSDEEDKREWQLYVGNREVFGFSYHYLDEEDILNVYYPKNLLMIERLEYGNAIVIPLSIKLSDGKVIYAESPDFNASFEEALNETIERRKLIQRIEKKEIGRLNAKMQELKLEKKKLNRIYEEEELNNKLKEIEESLSDLQADYEILAKRAKDLRALQFENVITYSPIEGVKKDLPLQQVVHFHYPNQMSVFSKIKMFIWNFWRFLCTNPREANTEGGIFPAIFGTFVMTLMMSVVVTPIGVLAAIYLREYAKPGPLVRIVRIAINNLAGVPSIVFGVFGLGFFVYFVGGTIDQIFFKDSLPTPTFGTGGILWASMTLALMTIPVVIVATEEALSAVPRGMREGSLALGASKWQTIQRVVMPASTTGIMTGFILAMARGAGEVAPLMLVGVVKLAPSLPLDLTFPFLHLERKFMHLGFHIYDLGFQSPDSEAAKPMVFATTLILISLVLVLNLSAVLIRQKLRRRYAVGTF